MTAWTSEEKVGSSTLDVSSTDGGGAELPLFSVDFFVRGIVILQLFALSLDSSPPPNQICQPAPRSSFTILIDSLIIVWSCGAGPYMTPGRHVTRGLYFFTSLIDTLRIVWSCGSRPVMTPGRA